MRDGFRLPLLLLLASACGSSGKVNGTTTTGTASAGTTAASSSAGHGTSTSTSATATAAAGTTASHGTTTGHHGASTVSSTTAGGSVGGSIAGSGGSISSTGGSTSSTGGSTSSGAVPMPSAANRPVYDSTNNSLTWSGPVGGGPSDGSYVQQTLALTTQNGDMTTTSDGQIIEGLNIIGTLTIANNNVTVRQCHIIYPTVNSANTNQIYQGMGTTGLVVEDNALDGNAVLGMGGTGNICGDNFAVSNAIIRRNNMYNSEQGVRYTLNNLSITENYFHNPGGMDADQIEVYPVGGTCDNLYIQYNYFTGPDNSQGGYNSGINMSTASGLPPGTIGPHITIDTNWFVNCPEYHTINNDASGGGSMSFSFTNNGIYNVAGGYGSTTLFGSGGGTVAPNSGNYIMATPTSYSGSLYNGNGQLD